MTAERFRAPVVPTVVRSAVEAVEPETEDSPEAARVLGKRWDGRERSALILDGPCELGFHCPACVYPQTTGGEFDERLTWSEYRTMLWCAVCGRDYPSALCVPDPVRATEVYLSSVAEILEATKPNAPEGKHS